MFVDDSLLEYYEACARDSSSEHDSNSSLCVGSSNEEDAGQSPWRAASGDSPLRGRARLRSPKHRSDLAQLKRQLGLSTDEKDDAGPCEGPAEGGDSSHGACNYQRWRGEEAQRVARMLAHPFEPYQRKPTVNDEDDEEEEARVPRKSTAATSPAASPGPREYHTAREQLALEQRADEAVRDAFVFDALCALRLGKTRYCEVAEVDHAQGPSRAPVRIQLRADAKASLEQRGWTPFVAALERLLVAASHVAALQAQLETFHDTVQGISAKVNITAIVGSALSDEAAQGSSVHATIALGEAAFHALFRVGVFARNLVRSFRSWVLEVQEFTAACQRGCSREVGAAHGVPRKAQRVESDVASGVELCAARDYFSTSPPSLLALLEAVELNVTPLLRLLVLLQESGCFSGLQDWAVEQHLVEPHQAQQGGSKGNGKPLTAAPVTEFDFAHICAELGAGLLDHLIVRLSALQDTSSMDLYRIYMMLLLHCAWPYVLLATATICGLVHSLDPSRWRRQLPRLFRSSFSHLRAGDAKRRLPTDILSLLLNCVGYDADANGTGFGSDVAAAATPGGGTEAHTNALSALTSSRRFILQCFATFAQKRRQQQRREKTRVVSQVLRGEATAAASTTSATRPVPTTAQATTASDLGGQGDTQRLGLKVDLGKARSMTVAEILGELVNHAGSEEGQPWDALFAAPPFPRTHEPPQPQRERGAALPETTDRGGAAPSAPRPVAAAASATVPAVGVVSEATTQTSLQLQFPSAVPLGFSAVDAQVPGQAAYRRAVRRREQRDELPLCSSISSLEEDDDDGNGTQEGNVGPATPTHPWAPRTGPGRQRSGSSSGGRTKAPVELRALWSIRVADSDTSPDLQLVNRADEAQRQRWPLGTSPKGHGGKEAKDLWLNTSIPAARWITAALLIPIGVVVQRLQERRLSHLLRRTRVQRSVPLTPFDLDANDDDDDAADSANGRSDGNSSAVRVTGADGRVLTGREQRQLLQLLRHGGANGDRVDGCQPHRCPLRRPAPSSLSFLHAVKLLLDVALCRDKSRLIDGFLEKLLREPHWWHRTPVSRAPDEAETSSRLISFVFADALRGKRFADLVSLTVLPKSAAPAAASAAGEGDADLLLCREMLDVFASFRLTFSFPDELALVLLPAELCVAVKPNAGSCEHWEDQVEQTYSTMFWEKRRGGGGSPGAATATATPTTADGIASSDVWSYAFGYLCALHYAQMVLREQRKALHVKDTQDHELLMALEAAQREPAPAPLPPERKARKVLGRPAQPTAVLSHRSPLTMVSRGLGSAYHALSFAVDALLTFTLREASSVIYRLEHALVSTETCGSVMQLCQAVDSLLLSLQLICFPVRPPRPSASPSAEAVSDGLALASDEVRRAVNTVLALSFDPSRMPVKLISARSRMAIEALVSLVTRLSEASVLKARLRPLLVLLTFNGFYGWEGEANYQFR